MKNIRFFLSENFHFLVVKFSVYLNRHVFVMILHNYSFSYIFWSFMIEPIQSFENLYESHCGEPIV